MFALSNITFLENHTVKFGKEELHNYFAFGGDLYD